MKKILSLLMLLVAIVTGAKADAVTLFDAADLADETVTSGTVTMDNSKWYGGSSASVDNGKTIAGVAWSKRIKFGGSSTFKTGSDFSRVLEVTVPSAGTLNVYFLSGSKGKTRYVYVSANPSSTNRDPDTAVISGSDDGNDGNVASGEVEAGTYYVWCAENIGVYGVTFEASAPAGPSITTQPENAEYLIGSTTYPSMTVEAEASEGTLSYQWELSTDSENFNAIPTTSVPSAATATLLGSEAIGLLPEQAATYYFRCKVTDSKGDVYTDVATLNVIAGAPTITTNLDAEYSVQKGKSITLSIVAEGASSYQWYLDNVAIVGATSDSYEYTANNEVGQAVAIYCVASNAAGNTGSQITTVTTTGSNACQLLQVQYSNGFYAFIKQPTAERPDDPYTITSYYLEGEDAPTIVSAGVTVSEGATWAVDGNTLTVTAEDGTTTAEFTINTPVAVSPYTGLGEYTFTADDTWVKTGYAFDTASNKKGWKFSKNDESDGKLRNADGRTRIYLFVGPSKTIKLTSGCSSDRDIRVFRNGTEVLSSTKLGKNGGTVSFNGDEDNAAMYEVRSAQTGGDGSIEKITIATSTEPVAIPSEGVATYVTKQALDFSTQNGTIKAYAVTAVSTTSATTAVVGQVPAGTPLLVKGAEGSYDIEVIASAEAITNLLLASDGTVQGGDNIYAYSKSALKFKKVASTVTIPAGKAYLQTTAGDALDIDFEGEATAVEAIAEANANAAAPVKVIKNGKLYIGNYNVAGQQVK